MRAILFALVATAALALIGQSGANAAAANGAAIGKAARHTDQIIMVRDGCGRGRHYSRWRGHCVWN
jgi:hypothetical protein